MARLRYMENARTGDPGTICTHTNKLFFDDTGAYINASASGTLNLVATTVAITGNLTVSGTTNFDAISVSFNQNLLEDFTVGDSSNGYDVKFYGDNNTKYLRWVASENKAYIAGAFDIVGNMDITGNITDISGTLGVTGLATLGSASVTGALTVGTTTGLIGKLTISPTTAGTFLDFELETDWVSGTLINADFASGDVTITGAIVGMLLDFATNVAAATGHDITGYQIKLPDLTASTSTTFIGFDLPAAGAIINTTGTFTWKGVNLQLPTMTESSGAVNVYGVYMAGATNNSGNEYGVYMTGIETGIEIAGASDTGISLTGTYTTAAISISTTFAGHADYGLYIAGTTSSTGGTNNSLYVSNIPAASNVEARAAEFLLAPTAKMGGWGNAVKAYLDMTGASGSGGLLAGLCAEIKLPDEQMTGTFAVLELELIAPGSFASSEEVGQNCVSFINTNLSGGTKDEINEHGYFLNVQGLTSGSGELLENNTLKCAIGSTEMFLLFSTTESSYTTDQPIVSTYSGDIGCYLHVTTAEAKNKYGLYSLITATHTSDYTVVGVYGDVSWTGAGGAVGLTGVQGRVLIGADFNGGTQYVYGTTGQLVFDSNTTINSAPSIFAAVNAVITGSSGTYTTGNICGLFIENLFDEDISSKSGVWAMLYMANDVLGHGPTDAIRLYGPWVDNFVHFAGCTNGGMVSNASAVATHGTLSKKIRIKIDGVTYYLLASTVPT